MSQSPQFVAVPSLGEPKLPSPLRRTTTPGDGLSKFITESHYVRHTVELDRDQVIEGELLFEKAGARPRIFFDPSSTRAAVVTCGGLCPGLNNVIRSVYLELHKNYGVPEVLGIRHGFRGLNPAEGDPPVELTMERVADIHEEGGTILGSSRGPQDAAVMVDFLVEQGINMLLCVGGDGTQRGALTIVEEIARRGLPLAVIGIPKTIDNDIGYVDRTFGFTTAVAEAQRVLSCAHVESKGVPYGVGLVKVMGREAGFIAAAAALASQEVNFALIPEVHFKLDGEGGFMDALHRRIVDRRHAVIVAAEGAGQDLFRTGDLGRDASGNVRLHDIGVLLKEEITRHFNLQGPKVSVKYMDPSYIIRSVPANCEDDILCDQFGRRAVHAAMAGKTGLLVGHMSGTFVHVPIAMAVGRKRRVDPEGELWTSVLAATGQPRQFE